MGGGGLPVPAGGMRPVPPGAGPQDEVVHVRLVGEPLPGVAGVLLAGGDLVAGVERALEHLILGAVARLDRFTAQPADPAITLEDLAAVDGLPDGLRLDASAPIEEGILRLVRVAPVVVTSRGTTLVEVGILERLAYASTTLAILGIGRIPLTVVTAFPRPPCLLLFFGGRSRLTSVVRVNVIPIRFTPLLVMPPLTRLAVGRSATRLCLVTVERVKGKFRFAARAELRRRRLIGHRHLLRVSVTPGASRMAPGHLHLPMRV
jgi:hypothetical protein